MAPYKSKKVFATTNNITKGIINYLLANGHSASRINTQGQWDENLGMWRKSGSRKGFFDIACCIKSPVKNIGIFLVIDVKKGNDTLSPDQIDFMNEIRSSGGIAFSIDSIDEFYERFDNLIKTLKSNGI